MKSARAEASRRAILDAAAAALSANPGASLAQIALRAGVGRTTLHRHFPSRGDLIQALSREALEETERATAHLQEGASSSSDALRMLFEAVIPLGDRYHFLINESADFYSDPDLTAQYQRQLRGVDELVDWLKWEGALAPDVPKAWVVTAIDILIWAAWSAVQDGAIARKDAPSLAFRTLMKGIQP